MSNPSDGPAEGKPGHPQHCSACGQFIGPIGLCKDCYPPERQQRRISPETLCFGVFFVLCVIWVVMNYV